VSTALATEAEGAVPEAGLLLPSEAGYVAESVSIWEAMATFVPTPAVGTDAVPDA
jgi:hypothetical protein